MILVGASLLPNAYNPRSSERVVSRVWLEDVLSGQQLVRFAWVSLWAFLRILADRGRLGLPAVEAHGH